MIASIRLIAGIKCNSDTIALVRVAKQDLTNYYVIAPAYPIPIRVTRKFRSIESSYIPVIPVSAV